MMGIAKHRIKNWGIGTRWAVVGFILFALVAFKPSVVRASVWQTYTLTVPPSPEDCWTSEELSPIAVGDYWTNVIDGDTANPETDTVLAGTQLIHSVSTSIIDSGGMLAYVTNDANGFRLHGAFVPDNDMGGGVVVDATETFSPPMKALNGWTCVGDHISSSGNTTIAFQGYYPITISYSQESDVMAPETVSVPFGSFQAVPVGYTYTLSSPIPGDPPFVTTGTDWYVPGIGPVKSTLTDSNSDVPSLVELTDTNLTAVPEPSVAWMQVAALIGLGTLSRLRRGVR